MKKIKVLLVGMSNNIGGIETYLYNLIKYSNKDEIQFDLLCVGDDKIAFEDDIKKMGCIIYKIIPRFKSYFKHIQQIRKIYSKRYDYIHLNIMTFSWFEPIMLAYKTKSNVIIHSHSASFGNNLSLKTKLLNNVGKSICRRVKSYKVACGDEAGKFMFEGDSYVVFNNGVDIDKFKYDEKNRKRIRKEYLIKENDIVMGLVARMEIQKNPIFLVEIFNKILCLNPNYKLMIVGEGKLIRDVNKKIKEYNIENKVILLGKRSNVNEILSAFDVYVMPSLYEGLSISLIEAQVNGLKCYTSDSVDKKSNITGNVKFLSLDNGAEFWARKILQDNKERDFKVIDKIPDNFNAQKSYEEVYKFYISNCNTK